jgi:hypothetical protein
MEHEKPPAIRNPARARQTVAIIVGLIAVIAVVAFVLALGHQEKKAPAPVRGDGVSPLEAAVPGRSKPPPAA